LCYNPPFPLSAQRFAQSSLFKRTVLEHIAADLLAMHFTPDPSVHGASGAPVLRCGTVDRCFVLRTRTAFWPATQHAQLCLHALFISR